MRIIDADGHVADNPTLAIEAVRRWPEHVKITADSRPGLTIEGPEKRGDWIEGGWRRDTCRPEISG
ncbi:hypothetical protein MB901379_02590 [Mycobacterium basiliense]|uniref:Amidohydrolase n=1 Tax=Mycobacterium basiliense TaxID=2094119 RepID=A0A3S4BIH5_9MYCO|nr:hypothetical protein MB901379_02590 [Mycobacterium basiliense]